jgi:hypothetical protein
VTKKILISAIAGTIVAGVAIAIAVITLFGKELTYATQSELLAAVPTTAKAELSTRGHTLATPLSCKNMQQATKENMYVSCAGMTTAKQRVQVFGAALAKTKDEFYTILVNGRPVVQNSSCLGADCHKE